MISAIYGLRAVSNIFFGDPSASLAKRWEKESPHDLDLWERIPALLLLAFMLLIGLRPMTISEDINQHVKSLSYEDVSPEKPELAIESAKTREKHHQDH